jgi:hypothetical protein
MSHPATFFAGLVCSAAALVAACSGTQAPTATTSLSLDSGPREVKTSPGKSRAPVGIEFDGTKGLAPGEVAEVEVTLLPQAALEDLHAVFTTSAGLVLHSGSEFVRAGAAAAGTPITHRITVSGPAGVHHVSLVITANVGGAPTARAESTVIVIGTSSVTSKPRHDSNSEVDSTGQRIKTLPAEQRSR